MNRFIAALCLTVMLGALCTGCTTSKEKNVTSTDNGTTVTETKKTSMPSTTGTTNGVTSKTSTTTKTYVPSRTGTTATRVVPFTGLPIPVPGHLPV